MEHLIFFLGLFSFFPSLFVPCSFFRARISRIRSKKTCDGIFPFSKSYITISRILTEKT